LLGVNGQEEGRAVGRALTLLVLIGLWACCAPVYTSNENAQLIRDFQDEVDYDAPPTMVHTVRPEYPEIARRVGADGVVRLKALILENGELAAVQILEGDNPILADAAITALRHSMFIPAQKGGQPCRGTMVIPFLFGAEEGRVGTLKGLEEADHTGTPQEDTLIPVEPPSGPEETIKPAK
jgi:TonB family protein